MKLSRFIIVAILAIAGSLTNSQAELRFGVKAGLVVNDLHFNNALWDGGNRAGFTAGAMLEYTAPALGIGFDVSAMYVGRNEKWANANGVDSKQRNYFEIPLNLKWRISIPLLNNIFRPYVATGPAFSVLAGRRSFSDFTSNRFDTSWNFGFGFDLFKKVQIGASYGLGLSKVFKAVNISEGNNVSARNRYWTITAAYMF